MTCAAADDELRVVAHRWLSASGADPRCARTDSTARSTVAGVRSLRQRRCLSGHSRAKHGLHSIASETTAAAVGQRRRELQATTSHRSRPRARRRQPRRAAEPESLLTATSAAAKRSTTSASDVTPHRLRTRASAARAATSSPIARSFAEPSTTTFAPALRERGGQRAVMRGGPAFRGPVLRARHQCDERLRRGAAECVARSRSRLCGIAGEPRPQRRAAATRGGSAPRG